MKTCGVRIFQSRVKKPCDCEMGCEACRIGCNNPARHKNPFFGKRFNFDYDVYWWRGYYTYTEDLCADCYDRMIEDIKETEDSYREGDPNYKEDPEFTKLLETL